MASTISAGTSAGTAIAIAGDTSGALALQTNNGTTAVTIDTAQNVGIGTTAPATGLEVSNANLGTALFTNPTTSGATTGGGIGFKVYNGTSVAQNGSIFATSSTWSYGTYSANQLNIGANGAGGVRIATATAPIVFNTGDASNAGLSAERMRIDSSGRVLFNLTTAFTGFGDTFSWYSAGGLQLSRSANGDQIGFYINGTFCGKISSSGSTTTYATSSDYRLKQDIAPMTGALAIVSALKPVTYKWKSDGTSSQGFIAHELQELVPECVVGEKDAVNEDGSIKPQGIDTSFLVATLTAAIQELNAKLEAQAVEIATLKAK